MVADEPDRLPVVVSVPLDHDRQATVLYGAGQLATVEEGTVMDMDLLLSSFAISRLSDQLVAA